MANHAKSTAVEDLYEDVWTRKLADPDWLAQDGGGRVADAVEILTRLLGAGIHEARILDIGCGHGILGKRLGKCAGMLGVDISGTAAAAAGKFYEAAYTVDLNREGLPLDSKCVDLVVMLDVFEHFLDPRPVLREALRVLVHGGHLLLCTPNILWWRHLLHMLLRRRFPLTGGREYGYDGGHLHSFSFRDVTGLLCEAGFAEIHDASLAPKRWLRDFRGPKLWFTALRLADLENTTHESPLP